MLMCFDLKFHSYRIRFKWEKGKWQWQNYIKHFSRILPKHSDLHGGWQDVPMDDNACSRMILGWASMKDEVYRYLFTDH